MKTKYRSTIMLLAAVFMVQFVYSQIPQSFSYQAVIRNTTGQPIASQSVKIQITLTDAAGTAIHYKETHTTTTSPLGLVNLNIGGGTLVSGNFTAVPWSGGTVYLKVEVDPAGGTAYTNLGSTKLTSVPFALYAASGTPGPVGATGPTGPAGATGATGPAGPLVAGTDGQTLRNNGTTWESSSLLFSDKTNSRIGVNTATPSASLHINGTARFGGLVYDNNNLTGSDGNVLTKTASGVLWQAPSSNITGSGITGNIAFWSGTSTLASLPNLSFTTSLQVVGAAPTTVDDPIFEVKNSAGQVLFGVYQEGVRINIVDGLIKGARGGFAVGGLTNQGKAGPAEYLRITPDSARIYVKSVPAKGAHGGFAVGGLTNQGKTTVSSQLIQLTPSNYLIGFESGTKITSGIYNSFLGYRSGKNATLASYNVFVGYQSGLNTTTGASNVFLGHDSGFGNTEGWSNNFIGEGAGYTNSTGTNNIFIGNDAGRLNTTSSGNTFIGRNSGYQNTGTSYGNTYIGHMSGEKLATGSNNTFAGVNAANNKTSGDNNVILGSFAGTNSADGSYNVFVGAGAGNNATGNYNVFIGNSAGYSETGSNKLYITNSSGSSPLIFGDFTLNQLTFNGNTTGVDNTGSSDAPAIIGQHNVSQNWGIGVKGTGGFIGVKGEAILGGGSGLRYGVYGIASGGATNYAGYFDGNVHVNGNINATGTITPSDFRLKKNIIQLSSSLKKVLSLQGVTYEWKTPEELSGLLPKSNSDKLEAANRFNFPSGIQIGVIAQDVEKIFPELVKTDSDGLKSVDYVKLAPVFIEAFKEQQQEIESLKAEIEQIKTMLKK